MKFVILSIALAVLTSCAGNYPDQKLPTNYCFKEHDSYNKIICKYSKFRNTIQDKVKYYHDQANNDRDYYRLSGMLIILLGVSIPLISHLNYKNKDLFMSLAGIIIACLTSYNSFFNWSDNWGAYRESEYKLKHAIHVWELSIEKLMVGTERSDLNVEAHKATEKLLNSAYKISLEENTEFFQRVSDYKASFNEEQKLNSDDSKN